MASDPSSNTAESRLNDPPQLPRPRTTQGRALSLLVRVFGRVPFRINQAFGAALGWLLWVIPNRNRKVAQRNIELCFPELDAAEQRRIVQGSMRSIGQGLTELGWLWCRPFDEVLAKVRTIHGEEVWEQALAGDGGVILAGPHLGSFELIGQYLARHTESSFLYRPPRDPGVEELIIEGRRRLGAELIPAQGRGVRQAYRALAAGRLVGILPDQQPKRGNGVFAPFFGHQAMTMVFFSKMVRKSGRPCLFAFAERLPKGQGYDIHFVAGDEAIGGEDLNEAVAALNRGVETCVRICPEQYAWGYKRFSIRPEGEEPIY